MSTRRRSWVAATPTSAVPCGLSPRPSPILGDVRTGILGGTFDPIHIGHLHAAECALHQLELDRVLVIPAGDPWQKSERTVTEARHRLAMCRLALEGVAHIEVDEREIGREGPTYTIETLESFPSDEELVLIVGADAAAGLDTWHRSSDVRDRADLAVVPRPGTPTPSPSDAVIIDMGLLEVSGTDIRARICSGRPFRYLVTGPVHNFIREQVLYTDRAGGDMVEAPERMERSS